jgi:hypothetical protein
VDVTIRRDDPVWAAGGVLGEARDVRYLRATHRIALQGFREAGYHEVAFDASQLALGIYFYRIQAGDFSDVKKMVLVK